MSTNKYVQPRPSFVLSVALTLSFAIAAGHCQIYFWLRDLDSRIADKLMIIIYIYKMSKRIYPTFVPQNKNVVENRNKVIPGMLHDLQLGELIR